jgi:glycosyltransferase involved in cell wall biosynthesis
MTMRHMPAIYIDRLRTSIEYRFMLSIVVPCHNEEASLAQLCLRLEAAAQAFSPFEIILIDDGSTDDTWALIERASMERPFITGISFTRNFGQQMAIAAGLEHAGGDRVLIMDADLQDPPELLATMMQKMDEGCDVVHALRHKREGEKPFKRASAWLFYRLLRKVSDVSIPVDTGDMKLLSRKAVDALNMLDERVRYTRGLVSWVGMKQAFVPYKRSARYAGSSSYGLCRMLRYAGDGITSFTTTPLILPLWFGAALGIISIFLLVCALLSWNIQLAAAGVGALLFSATWLMLGMMGSYLAVIHREVKARPHYLIAKVTAPRSSA